MSLQQNPVLKLKLTNIIIYYLQLAHPRAGEYHLIVHKVMQNVLNNVKLLELTALVPHAKLCEEEHCCIK